MDETAVKRAYFSLIASASARERNEALDALKKIDSDNVRILLNCGPLIARALDNEASAIELERALTHFQGLQMLDYWYSFIETSAAALLSKGAAARNGKMLLFGLRMMRLVTSAGFPISGTSMGLVRKTREADRSLSVFVYDLLKEAKERE